MSTLEESTVVHSVADMQMQSCLILVLSLRTWRQDQFDLQIVREIASKELPLTRQLMSTFVYFHIVARNCQGVLTMLRDMRSQGFEPSEELLEMALKRMEREGHREGIDALVSQIGHRNWKIYSARNTVSRHHSLSFSSILNPKFTSGMIHEL